MMKSECDDKMDIGTSGKSERCLRGELIIDILLRTANGLGYRTRDQSQRKLRTECNAVPRIPVEAGGKILTAVG